MARSRDQGLGSAGLLLRRLRQQRRIRVAETDSPAEITDSTSCLRRLHRSVSGIFSNAGSGFGPASGQSNAHESTKTTGFVRSVAAHAPPLRDGGTGGTRRVASASAVTSFHCGHVPVTSLHRGHIPHPRPHHRPGQRIHLTASRSRALTDRDVKAARDVTHGDVTHTVVLPAALTASACRRPGTQRPLCSSESRAPPADAAALTDGDVDPGPVHDPR